MMGHEPNRPFEAHRLTTLLDQELREVVHLAMLGSLAARLEPQLIRALRLELAPQLHPCVEADLWFSTLVETHAATGIVLKASIVPELRTRLAADKSLLDAVWKIIHRFHRRGSPTLLAEEELSWLTLRGLGDPSNRERATAILRRLVATLVTDDYPNLVNWATRAMLRLPKSLFALEETKMLALGSVYRGATFSDLLNEEAFGGWGDVPWLQPRNPRGRSIGIRMVEEGVEIGPPGLRGGHTLTSSAIRDGPVKVSWVDDEGEHEVTVKVDPSKVQFVETASTEVRIGFVAGGAYRLRRTSNRFIKGRRGPRVHITYPSPFNPDDPVELPFVTGVIADLAGNAPGMPPPPFDRRAFRDVDFDSFDSFMASVSPGVSLSIANRLTENVEESLQIALTFATMSDFAPGKIVGKVPALTELLKQREKLAALASWMARDRDIEEAVITTIGGKEIEVAAISPLEARTRMPTEKAHLQSLEEGLRVLKEVKARGLPPSLNPGEFIQTAIARIDKLLTDQMNEILHAPEFQALEGAWRGLHYLVFSSETDMTLKIRVMTAGKAELRDHLLPADGDAWDQSFLFKRIYEENYGQLGGEPYGCLIGDYYFGHVSEDVELLRSISKIAGAAHAPFLSAASPALLGMDSWSELADPQYALTNLSHPDYARLNDLRDSADAKYLGLCLPRMLARVPYGPQSNPVSEFPFKEDTSGQAGEGYVWMNSCYAMAANVNRAFSEYGWCARIKGVQSGGETANLPTHTFPTEDGSGDLDCPTEIAIWDRREGELAKAGLIALACGPTSADQPVFLDAPSLARPMDYINNPDATQASHLATRLPAIFVASRFAQYIKVMNRDKIGAYLSRENVVNWLNGWIVDYVDPDPANSSEEGKAKRPIAAARISIDGMASSGYYKAILEINPQYQFENVNLGLRIEMRLPDTSAFVDDPSPEA